MPRSNEFKIKFHFVATLFRLFDEKRVYLDEDNDLTLEYGGQFTELVKWIDYHD